MSVHLIQLAPLKKVRLHKKQKNYTFISKIEKEIKPNKENKVWHLAN